MRIYFQLHSFLGTHTPPAQPARTQEARYSSSQQSCTQHIDLGLFCEALLLLRETNHSAKQGQQQAASSTSCTNTAKVKQESRHFFKHSYSTVLVAEKEGILVCNFKNNCQFWVFLQLLPNQKGCYKESRIPAVPESWILLKKLCLIWNSGETPQILQSQKYSFLTEEKQLNLNAHLDGKIEISQKTPLCQLTYKTQCNTHPDYSGDKEQHALLFAILTVGILFNTQFLLILRSPSLLITTKTSRLAIRL